VLTVATAEATSLPVAASTSFTVWLPVLPASTQRPKAVISMSFGPTLRLLPSQPVKSCRTLVGVKEVTNGVMAPGAVVVVVVAGAVVVVVAGTAVVVVVGAVVVVVVVAGVVVEVVEVVVVVGAVVVVVGGPAEREHSVTFPAPSVTFISRSKGFVSSTRVATTSTSENAP
jgi:hypothetical protein